MPAANDVGATGVLGPEGDASDFNALSFMIRQALASVRTATLVRVDAVTNDGGLAPVGFVDVTILVQRMDGAGNVIDAGQVYDLPYLRLQGGGNAVILDPQPGDIGLALMADRDISSVKASKAPAAPGSARRHDMADGIYLGGVLNGTPNQYVQFQAGGISLVSPGTVTIHAPVTAVQGDLTVTGKVTAQGDVVGQGISLATHVHKGVTPGNGVSGLPQ